VSADPAGPLALALNAGSSTLKWGLFADGGETPVDEGMAEWESGTEVGLDAALRDLLARTGADAGRIAVVGHRVVHGGARFSAPTVIDAAVREEIARLVPLAPLHNPAALAGIDASARALPGVPQAAVFDTAFFRTLPPAASTYAVPAEWRERFGVRRFGFHGISHAWSARRAAELAGERRRRPFRVVTCHLGSGCSLAASAEGEAVATTMGYTPLDGIVMATRPGALDPGIPLAMLRERGLTLDDLDRALHHESGLSGLSGGISDMRELLARRASGDERAALAVDCFLWSLRAGIAAMAAALQGIDALVFTAGIGEHQPAIRAECCGGLGWLGVALDPAANAAAAGDDDMDMDMDVNADIGAAGAPVRAFVVRAREEQCVARDAWRAVHP